MKGVCAGCLQRFVYSAMLLCSQMWATCGYNVNTELLTGIKRLCPLALSPQQLQVCLVSLIDVV